jgi:hypothetical protein
VTQPDQPRTAELGVLREIRDLLLLVVQRWPDADHRALSAEDRQVLESLLPVVSQAIGSALFTLRDLAEQAETDDALKVALGCVSARRLGKLFARSAGFPVDGVRVERVGNVREGILWRVARR